MRILAGSILAGSPKTNRPKISKLPLDASPAIIKWWRALRNAAIDELPLGFNNGAQGKDNPIIVEQSVCAYGQMYGASMRSALHGRAVG